MKRLFTALLCLAMISSVAACSSDKKEASSEKSKEVKKDNFTKAGRAKAEKIVKQLKDSNTNIDYFINYDINNDMNEHPSYIGKVSFNDKSISSDYDPEEPLSGTIEVYKSNKEAVKRADYLSNISPVLDDFGNHIISDNVLVRLSKDYTKADIDNFAKILNAEVYRYRNSSDDDKSEAPKEESDAESAKTETPKTESPKTETPNVETPKTEPSPAPAEPSTPSVPDVNIENTNALNSAKRYIAIMPFSYTGLINQLLYEGYSSEAATYAVNNCGANWNDQAAKKAQSYLNIMSFSRQGLIDQLIYDGYTQDQAIYGVTAVGY